MPHKITTKQAIRKAINTLKSAGLHKSFWKATMRQVLQAADNEIFRYIQRFEQKHIPMGKRDEMITHAIAHLEKDRKKLATRGYNFSLEKIIKIATINEKLRLLGRVHNYYVKARIDRARMQ